MKCKQRNNTTQIPSRMHHARIGTPTDSNALGFSPCVRPLTFDRCATMEHVTFDNGTDV